MPTHRIVVLIFIFCMLFTVSVGAANPPILTAPPLGEQWFSISMGGERTGFTRTAINAAPDGYEVTSDSSARMVVMGFSRNAWSRETYRVSRDLSIKSFHVDEAIDGKKKTLSGAVTAQGVKVSVTEGGKRRETILKLHGKIYPGPLLNIYPLVQGGLAKDKSFSPRTLDIEEVKIRNVTITVVGWEKLDGGAEALHLRNDVYPMVDNDIWVNPSGNTIRESVRDDLIVTASETGAAARQELFAAALAKKEWLADFSAIGSDRPLTHPGELKKLVVELTGLPADMPLISSVGQKAERQVGGEVLYTLTKVPMPQPSGGNGAVIPDLAGKPEQGVAAHHDREALAALEKAIVGEEKDHAVRVEKLVRWIADNVADYGKDLPPLETLRLKKGDSISRVRLYAALAEASGVPTRIVAGLVHSGEKAFHFHVWAESYVGEWLPVDPCAGQAPADAAHIKLTESISPMETAELAGLIGHLQATIVEEHY
jgi:Transglutaminase-like superfamily